MSQYGEPWDVRERESSPPPDWPFSDSRVYADNGDMVCVDAAPALRSRIVACVNFCAGIPTDVLKTLAENPGLDQLIVCWEQEG